MILRQAGFTLLELMIAVSIFAILGIGSYRLLSGEIATQERLLAHSSERQQWQRGLRKLQQDLMQLSARPIRTAYDDKEPAFIGRSDSVTFTRNGWANPLGHKRSQLQRISYRLGKSEKTSEESDYPELLREYWQVLDQAQDSEPKQQVLLRHIEQLELRYLDEEGKWHQRWPREAAAQYQEVTEQEVEEQSDTSLPIGIEIRLQSPIHGEIVRLLALGNRAQAPDNDNGEKP